MSISKVIQLSYNMCKIEFKQIIIYSLSIFFSLFHLLCQTQMMKTIFSIIPIFFIFPFFYHSNHFFIFPTKQSLKFILRSRNLEEYWNSSGEREELNHIVKSNKNLIMLKFVLLLIHQKVLPFQNYVSLAEMIQAGL